MKPGIPRLAEKPVKCMAHLVKERNKVSIHHQRRHCWRWLRKVGDHRSNWVISLPVWKLVACQKWKHGGMRVFEL
jgi:hypothetical protein